MHKGQQALLVLKEQPELWVLKEPQVTLGQAVHRALKARMVLLALKALRVLAAHRVLPVWLGHKALLALKALLGTTG